MATKLKRLMTNLEWNLYSIFLEDARRNHRSESQQAAFIIERYYAEREKEAELFEAQRLQKKSEDIPFYGKPQPEPGQSSKRHGTRG